MLLVSNDLILQSRNLVVQLLRLPLVDLLEAGPLLHHFLDLQPIRWVLVALPFQELVGAVEFLYLLCPFEVFLLYALEIVDHVHDVD